MGYFNESTQPDIMQEIQENNLIPVIEIEVKSIETGEKEYIICDLVQDFDNNTLYCQREGVSREEEESDMIASSCIVIDHDFSIDENLQALHEAITQDIIDGNLFDLV